MSTTSKVPRHIAISIVAYVILFAGVIIYRWLRPMPLTEHARIVLQAMQLGDGNTLMKYAFDKEIEANGLSANKLSRLYNQKILVDFAPFHPDGPMILQMLGNGDSASADQPMIDAKGRKFNMTAVVQSTDDGPKKSVLGPILSGWVARNMVSKDVPFTVLSRVEAQLEGLMADRKYLESLGIKSFVLIDYVNGKLDVNDLDRLQQGWEARIARARSQVQSTR